jgi:hypothetical protein
MPLCNQSQYCNPVYNFQQNGMSRKMLLSKMIQTGRSINYANSETETFYKIILSLDYVANKKLLLRLKYRLYNRYFNQLISCGKPNLHAIIKMKDDIIANLTPEEYNIVFEINTDVIEEIVINTIITKTFYVTVDVNRKFFLIKNYNGEYFRPNNSYEFNLEDPSNLNTRFCLSQRQNSVPINGLVYEGIPGTSGASVIFNAPNNISYNLYVFNSLTGSVIEAYTWGYGQPLLPVIDVNKNIYTKSSYIPLSVEQKLSLSVYYNSALKFFIQTASIAFFTISSVNYNYLFYYGTYYIQVPKIYSLALLNKGQEYSIRYSGDINKSNTTNVIGTTNDGTYNFYYDTITITIYDAFTPISMYSQLYGYMSATDAIIFSPLAASLAKPEIRNDHVIDEFGIEKVYGQTKINIDFSNNSITLNNNVTNSNVTKYGVYNGTYIFYTSEFITFLNKEKEDIFIVSGINGIVGPGPDGYTNYTFFSGVIQIKILGNFNKMSIYTFNKGYCNGLYILNYGNTYNTYLPHSYPFTNIDKSILSETSPIVYTNSIPLNSTTLDFIGDNGSTIVKSVERQSINYNVILSDANNNIVFVDMSANADAAGNIVITRLSNNIIPYNSTTQYTMKKGTYVFFNLSGLFITFMTNNKPIIINDRYNVGVYFTKGTSPNGDSYIFNKSDPTALALLKPIVITVTNDFGYLSVCTPSGYNGGKDLIRYSKT